MLGQLPALGASRSLRVVDLPSFGQSSAVANAGVVVAPIAYVGVCGGFAMHLGGSE